MLRWSIAVILLLVTISNCFSADRYWIAGTTANWNNTANWSTTSGGAGGASVPGSGDVAKFDGNGTGNCTIDAAVNVAGIDVQAGYTGIISQGANTITIGTSNAVFAGGTFTGGSSAITLNGSLTISGTAFTSSSDVLTLNSNFSKTGGSFSHNNGTIKVNASSTITGSMTFYNLEFTGAATMTITIASGTTIITANDLTYSGASGITVNTGELHAQGNIYLNNTSATGGGNASLVINGGGSQTINGFASSSAISRLPSVDIKKSTGTLTFSNYMAVAGNWTYTSGTVSYGTSSVIFVTSKTISGSMQFYNIIFEPGTYTLSSGTTLTANGSLEITGSGACTINGSSSFIDVIQNITVSNTGSGGGGDATIRITGTGSQTLTGNGITNTGRLCKININKPSGTLSLSSTISCSNDWTYIQGTVKAGSSTVAMCTAANLDAQGTSANMTFNDLNIYSETITLTGDLTVGRNLTIRSGATLSGSSYRIYLKGSWSNSGTFSAGTSTVEFNGTSVQTASNSTLTETFYNLTMNNTVSRLKLVSAIRIQSTLTLTNGPIQGNSSYPVILADNATVSGGSDLSYVSGPVTKIGDDPFTFPLGSISLSNPYHPLTITAPSSASDEFTATYVFGDPSAAYGSTLGTGIKSITTCEYWTLEQVTGTSTVTATLSYNDPACGIDPFDGIVAQWNGTQWVDHGNSAYSVSGSLYSIRGAVAISSFSPDPAPLTLGIQAPQYYAVMKKKLDGGYYTAINGELQFRFDEEYKDSDNSLTYNIYTDMHSLVSSPPSQSVQYGDNRYAIDLTSILSMTSGYYILEVVNEKDEKWYLRFKY